MHGPDLANSALWAAGLSVILAGLGYTSWLGREQGQSWRAILARALGQASTSSGLVLISLGLLGSAGSLGERLLWGLFALFFAGLAWRAWRGQRGTALSAAKPVQGVRGWRQWLAGALSWCELPLSLAATPLLVLPTRYAPWALAGLALLGLARLAAGGRLAPRTPLDGAILALLLWLPVTVWASVDMSLTLPALYRLAAGIALFYALADWGSSQARLAAVAGLFVLMGAGLAVLAPFAASDWAAKLFRALPILQRVVGRTGPRLGEDINPNVLAGGLGIIWPVITALAFTRLEGPRGRRILMRTGLLTALLLCSGILVLTQSRGMVLGLAAALTLLTLLRWPRLWPAFVAMGGAAALAVWRSGLQPLADALSQTGTVTSWAGRQEIWSRAACMVRDFPFTGIGLGTFGRVQPLLYPFFVLAGKPIPHAHNLFLQGALDLGLPGVAAYWALLIGIVALTWRSWQILRRSPQHWPAALALGLLGSETVFLVHGLVDAALWANKLAFLPWYVFGLALALHSAIRDRA